MLSSGEGDRPTSERIAERFASNDAWQKEMRNRWLVPYVYSTGALAFGDVPMVAGAYCLMDGPSWQREINRSMHIDTILGFMDGSARSLDEKIARWKGREHDAFFLETKDSTLPGRGRNGIMLTAPPHCPDGVLYCFQNEAPGLSCWLLHLARLKELFHGNLSSWPTRVLRHEPSQPEGSVVPITAVKQADGVVLQQFIVGEDGVTFPG